MQIYELIRGLISSDLSYATTGLEIFLMYTNNHPQLLEFVQSVDRYTFRQFLGLMLSKQRNDPANTVLRQYFFTSSMLIRSLIHTTRPVGPNILEESFRNQREKDENLRSKQAFYSRVIQFMQAEGELYSRNQIKEQM